MPFTIFGHSMIQYDEKSIYIIGGYQNDSLSRQTWIVDPTKFKFNEFHMMEGPPLLVERSSHACAKMTINGSTLLVVAGGISSDGTLDSVEILDPSSNNIWTPGL